MKQDSLQRIDGFLTTSAIDLFASYGVSVEPGPERIGGIDNPFAATIGFTSTDLHGVLVMTIAREIAARCLPPNLRVEAPKDEIVADWTGELSNQMLGRLKNRFHAVGVDISLSTPCVFIGKEMRHYSHESPIQRSLYLDEGRVLIEFHADYEKDFEIKGEAEGAGSGPPEGEAIFF